MIVTPSQITYQILLLISDKTKTRHHINMKVKLLQISHQTNNSSIKYDSDTSSQITYQILLFAIKNYQV